MTPAAEDLLRELAPQVLAALVRRYGHFEACEDAVQEALLAATALPTPPDEPRPWLIRVASRKLIDQLRSEQARREREQTVVRLTVPPDARDEDDTLVLLFLCCHPSLTPASQVALTLRAVGGLTTAEIARAFLTSEATMAQRISRAKQQVRASGQPFALPPATDRAARLATVLQVLYLIFNEGYAATAGPDLVRGDLSAEAIRLTRTVRRLLPVEPEVTGLLALMLLVEARRPARVSATGAAVPLDEQDRSLWTRPLIEEGEALVEAALAAGPGPYRLQAAIAALHSSAPTAADTDWPQIAALYAALEDLTGNPVVRLNRAVAVAMVAGPAEGLTLLEPLDFSYRVDAVRAHLYEMAGSHALAVHCYRAAAEATPNEVERRHLLGRAARLERQP